MVLWQVITPSRNKIHKGQIDQIHKKLIGHEYFTDNKESTLFCTNTMTFQQDDLFKKDNSFGAAAGFVAEIDGSFPSKAPRDLSHLLQANFLFNLND